MIEYFGKKPIYYETKSEQEKRLADNMLSYCDMRLKEINGKFPHEKEMKLLAIRLHLKTDLGLDDSYRVVFEKCDYYDIKHFDMDDFDIYNEYLGDDLLIPMSEFDDIVLANKSLSECLELGFEIDENEYRRAEYFRNNYDLELLDFVDIEYEMCGNTDFRKWLRDIEYYYEIQDEIDGIIKDWKEEYKVEF